MEIQYNNWILDSQEELYFIWWLEELQSAGFIESFYRIEEPIVIFEKTSFDFIVGNKELSKPILRKINYTPDFYIQWADKAEGIFLAVVNGSYTKEQFKRCVFYCESNKVSIVDVKGTFSGRLISAITFPIIQKILFHKNIFVQKVVPLGDKGLFANTFTPAKYFLTPKTGKQRKTSFKMERLNKYLNL